MLLAGDIGGTKTKLAIFSPEDGARTPLAEATFSSGHYPSLEAVAQEFLGRVDASIDRASFGVAGPVVDGRAKITNLPWLMDEVQLRKALNVPSVRLLNDLEAIAYSISSLEAADLHTLNEGKPVAHSPLAVIAPGTGLGEAFLTWDGRKYRVHPSEGGHADFAPIDQLQRGLLGYLQGRNNHVSVERVCSGLGLPNIYAYLKDSGYAPEPPWLAEQLAAATDRTPPIIKAALERPSECELCATALDTFVSILGAEAGNLTLKILATGGVYLGGGIPPRILPVLDGGRFMQAFVRKGRFTDMLHNVPVHIILNPEVALFGAACHGLEAHV
jgi:glucokinase